MEKMMYDTDPAGPLFRLSCGVAIKLFILCVFMGFYRLSGRTVPKYSMPQEGGSVDTV